MQSAEVDWQTLDKTRFFVVGGAMFTGLTTCLFPLSVIKTRQMALENAPRGIKGAYLTAQSIVQHDGVRGLYKGFGTTISGAIPTRIVYLSALEIIKSATSSVLHRYHLSDTANVGLASFIAGGGASLVAQAVYVPVDVVSQRLMIMGGGLPSAQHTAAQQASSASIAPAAGASSAMGGGSSSGGSSTASRVPQQQQQLQQQQQQQQIRQQQGHSRPQPRMNGLHVARQIVAVEGVRGLYRGFGASVMTFVPNSAIWWGCYGAYQRLFWHQIDAWRGAHRRSEGELLAVQATAGVLTGFTTASITNPLDVVKTRLQTRDFVPGTEQPTISGVVGQLLRTEGVKGFYRGVAPRMVSSAIWGTAMVTTYEFLKRLCALPPRPQTAAAAL